MRTIKQVLFFVLGFVTGIAILFWPRKDEKVPEEEYDAYFLFSINETTDFIVDHLTRAGYTYMGVRPIPQNQASQWEYRMEDAPDWAIIEHSNTLMKLGVNPGISVIRKSDGENIWELTAK